MPFLQIRCLLLSLIICSACPHVTNALAQLGKNAQPPINLHTNNDGETRRSFAHSVATFGVSAVVGTSLPLIQNPLVANAVGEPPKKLTFETLESGVRWADILVGGGTSNNDNIVVKQNSKVNVHILGRLLGKQGWIFQNSQAAGEDPFRLDLGTGTVVIGLEEGLQGMRPGGRRRIVVPSTVGYTSRQLEPIPREFSNKQRLYTTVMNNNRIEREREALGADLAGVVVFDVDLLRFRN